MGGYERLRTTVWFPALIRVRHFIFLLEYLEAKVYDVAKQPLKGEERQGDACSLC